MKKAYLGTVLLGLLLPLQFSVAHAATFRHDLSIDLDNKQVTHGFLSPDVWNSPQIMFPQKLLNKGDVLVLDVNFDDQINVRDALINNRESIGFMIGGSGGTGGASLMI